MLTFSPIIGQCSFLYYSELTIYIIKIITNLCVCVCVFVRKSMCVCAPNLKKMGSAL